MATTMEVDPTPGNSGLKRKREDIIVDPDTKQEIQDPKRPRMVLDTEKKVRCLKTLVSAYDNLVVLVASIKSPVDPKKRETVVANTAVIRELRSEVLFASQVTSVLFTAHNFHRQRVKTTTTNIQMKVASTEYNMRYRGVDYSLKREDVHRLWVEEARKNQLEYKNFALDNEENWYGTMGPYLDMFAAFKLRLDELRLGHGTMPITKKNGTHTSFQVSKYGLTGAHHILLEGSSFPPERRSSIVQSLGPMTVFLCMIRTEGIYRGKFAAAVKRAMAHLPAIDDIIEITKNVKMSFELSTMITLIAEILLITTSRQATRMCFPINFLSCVLESMDENAKSEFLKFYNTTGSGGWLLYKRCMTMEWKMQGNMTEEVAAQMLYHSIFGTYKEDLSILSQITTTGNWYTREEMGNAFRGMTSGGLVNLKPPIQKLYAKMSCANQTGLLSGVYNQVSCLPCFSGPRIQSYGEDFFDHIEKRRIIGSGGKNLQQITTSLTSTLEELHQLIRKEGGRVKMGTATWRDIASLDVGVPGNEVDAKLIGAGKMFMGRNSK